MRLRPVLERRRIQCESVVDEDRRDQSMFSVNDMLEVVEIAERAKEDLVAEKILHKMALREMAAFLEAGDIPQLRRRLGIPPQADEL